MTAEDVDAEFESAFRAVYQLDPELARATAALALSGIADWDEHLEALMDSRMAEHVERRAA